MNVAKLFGGRQQAAAVEPLERNVEDGHRVRRVARHTSRGDGVGDLLNARAMAFAQGGYFGGVGARWHEEEKLPVVENV